MNTIILIAADLAAITVLTLALYLRRPRRRDLVVSYLGMNAGVLAVATALSGSAAGLGLGLGLFGVLSIIRLRSTELAQHEVAYYFSALALGLIAGIGVEPLWLTLSLMALVLLVMFVGDNPKVLPAYRHQTVVLDRAISDEQELTARLEEVLNGTVHAATVQELDLVKCAGFRSSPGQPSVSTNRPARSPRHLRNCPVPGTPPPPQLVPHEPPRAGPDHSEP